MSDIHEMTGSIDAPELEILGSREETSLFGFANVLLKYRGMIAVLIVAFGLFGAFKFYFTIPSYTTRIGINVAANQQSDVNGLAAQLGIAHSTASAEEVAFFSELLRSPPLLHLVVAGPFTVQTKKGSVSGPLSRFYGLKGPAKVHEDEMTNTLNAGLRVSGSSRTGNIWVYVEAPFPDLAQQVARKMIALIDDYSRARKHAQAAAEREFIEGRVAESKAELQIAEDKVVQFRVENRDFSSPSLGMTNARLQRDVTMKQQLYTSLLQSYDRARIEAARTLTSVTVLENPERPLEPEQSAALSYPLLGAIAGLMIGIVLAFVRERLAETAAAPTPAFDHYLELKRQAIRDLKHPLRPFGRAGKQFSDG